LPLTDTGGKPLLRGWSGVTPARAAVAPTTTAANDKVVVRIVCLVEKLWNEGWSTLEVDSVHGKL
jgi:hypothetical protein